MATSMAGLADEVGVEGITPTGTEEMTAKALPRFRAYERMPNCKRATRCAQKPIGRYLLIPYRSLTIRALMLRGDFMPAVRSRNLQFGLLLAAGLAFSLWPAASRAYTPEQEQACTSDAFRLCSAEIPNIERVTACMVRNRSQLSPPCRAQFRPEPEEAPAVTRVRTGRPLSIGPATQRKHVSIKPRKAKKRTKRRTS